MTAAYIIGIVVLLFVAFLYIRNRLPAHMGVSRSEIGAYIKALHKRGYDGGFIVIKAKRRKEFVQLSKHILNPGEVTLTIDFPHAEWSEQYWGDLAKYAEVKGFSSRLVQKSEELEFRIIECGENINECIKLVIGIFEDVFAIRREEMIFNISFDGVSPYEERVGY